MEPCFAVDAVHEIQEGDQIGGAQIEFVLRAAEIEATVGSELAFGVLAAMADADRFAGSGEEGEWGAFAGSPAEHFTGLQTNRADVGECQSRASAKSVQCSQRLIAGDGQEV